MDESIITTGEVLETLQEKLHEYALRYLSFSENFKGKIDAIRSAWNDQTLEEFYSQYVFECEPTIEEINGEMCDFADTDIENKKNQLMDYLTSQIN